MINMGLLFCHYLCALLFTRSALLLHWYIITSPPCCIVPFTRPASLLCLLFCFIAESFLLSSTATSFSSLLLFFFGASLRLVVSNLSLSAVLPLSTATSFSSFLSFLLSSTATSFSSLLPLLLSSDALPFVDLLFFWIGASSLATSATLSSSPCLLLCFIAESFLLSSTATSFSSLLPFLLSSTATSFSSLLLFIFGASLRLVVSTLSLSAGLHPLLFNTGQKSLCFLRDTLPDFSSI
ncbi:hypothetical protein ACHAWT_004742 [Skeletonema menzelii]